jgi:glycosyltransferase involved in cell wall biosynthesis
VVKLDGVRIAQIIECDGPGGAERVVAHLASVLVERGAQVVAYLPRGTEGWLGEQLRDTRITIVPFDRRKAFHPRFWRWLTESLRTHRIALAHSHEFTFAVHAGWSAWRLGIGHVATIHGGRYWAGAWRRRTMLRLAIKLGGELTAVSPALKRELASDLGLADDAIAHIPNGVPCPRRGCRERVRRELGLGASDTLALALGSLYPVKGHRVLVDAVGTLAASHETLHVAIAGRGGELEPLQAQARELGVANRLHMMGLRTDVPDLLAATDVFVMPSLNEGLPMALLEAMCAGTPVIASAVGAIPAALQHGELGRIVPPNDPIALAAALADVLSDPADAGRVAARAQQHAQEEFSVERMVDRYVELYERQLR